MTKQFKTAQEACDYSVQKLVEQGGRCYNVVDGVCVYGDGHGNHCAIGWLLDPNNKDLMSYAGSFDDLPSSYPDEVPVIIHNNLDLFAALQDFHDKPDSIIREYYRNRLRYNYKIDTSAPHWQQWVDMGAE